LKMPAERSSIKEKGHLQTEPKESGPDANISTTIQFDINLPKDRLYWPNLTAACNDHVVKGLS
jgi:hypothetical protein